MLPILEQIRVLSQDVLTCHWAQCIIAVVVLVGIELKLVHHMIHPRQYSSHSRAIGTG